MSQAYTLVGETLESGMARILGEVFAGADHTGYVLKCQNAVGFTIGGCNVLLMMVAPTEVVAGVTTSQDVLRYVTLAPGSTPFWESGRVASVDWAAMPDSDEPSALAIRKWLIEEAAKGTLSPELRVWLHHAKEFAEARKRGVTKERYCREKGFDTKTLNKWMDILKKDGFLGS